MRIREIYEKAIKKAVKEDPRPWGAVKKDLKRSKHLYADSRILYGPGNKDVKNVLVGIDIEVQELLLADRLREKGVKIDLAISHHPAGRAYAQLDKVLPIQPGIWETLGFSKEVAEGVMKERMAEVARKISSQNHARAVDAAKLLNIPFMCLHTAADNCVTSFLQRQFDRRRPRKLGHVMRVFEKIPEYKHAMKTGVGPHILIGRKNNDAGKIFVDMTGGTNGPDKVFARLSQSGIKTIVAMHIKESGYKVAKCEFLNYVVAGHIASDNLGMNILFDAVDPKGKLRFIECSGFKRFRR